MAVGQRVAGSYTKRFLGQNILKPIFPNVFLTFKSLLMLINESNNKTDVITFFGRSLTESFWLSYAKVVLYYFTQW